MDTGNTIGHVPVQSASLLTSSRFTTNSQANHAEEIAAAGKEFEGVFLSMLLKNMRSTVSDEGMFAGDNSDTLGGMFDMFMSQHLAENDSLGVRSMIEGFLNNNSKES